MKKELLLQRISDQITPVQENRELLLIKIFSLIDMHRDFSDLSPGDRAEICGIILESVH